MKRWLVRLAPPLLVGVLPATLLSVGVAKFILNHFYGHPPYLLDSGWYSAIVYRAGVFPLNPQIACNYAEWYFGIHFSPFVSLFSILSYLAPIGRIEWYAVFQAVVFLPIGIATCALASQIEPAGALRRLPVTTIAALAFALNGLVLSFIGYPHYEPAIPGLICLVLVAVVTGRSRPAWVFLVLAVSVREDAGFHTALALSPLLYLHWRGVEMPPSRRALVAMMGVATAASLTGMAVQKLFFHPASLLRGEYLGTPIYGHLSVAVIADRAQTFLASCQHIYYPFIATLIIAAGRRDARYLLGWAATIPWFVFNFLAAQENKAIFSTYIGFPFIVSMFWVYLYGAKLAPLQRRLRPGLVELLFALVAVSSTIGACRSMPVATQRVARSMAFSGSWNRSVVHEFVDVLGEKRASFGNLYVDGPIAALALEAVRPGDIWYPGVAPADTIVFHRDSFRKTASIIRDLVANRLDVCARVLPTRIVVCSREPLPADTFAGLATETTPAVLVFSNLGAPDISVGPRGVELRNRIILHGQLGSLPVAKYELRFKFDTDAQAPERARLEVDTGATDEIVFAPLGSHEIMSTFTADAMHGALFRLSSTSAAPLTITSAVLRVVAP